MDDKHRKDEQKAVPVSGASASDTFCRTMCEMICQKDVDIIQSLQTEALSKFEKTNEKFDQFNRLSAERYARLHNHFQNHTKMLLDMKKDLDIVFRRIRNLKIKLTKQYGDAFKVTAKNIHELEEELESQSEIGLSEEKPQKESQQQTDENASNIEHGIAREKLLAGAQSKATTSENTKDHAVETVLAETGQIQKSGDEISKNQEKKTAYRTKLKPQLSSSDESYGNESDDDDKDTNMINMPEGACTDDVCKSQQDVESLMESNKENTSNSSNIICSEDKAKFTSSDESLESDSDDNNIKEVTNNT